MPKTIVVDFETYYDKDYHLRAKGMTYPAYIHDKRFLVHGLAVDDGKTQHWVTRKDVPAFLRSVKRDILVAHNGFFDFGVLKWHYDFTPAYMLCTLALANHVFGSAREQGGQRNDLGALAQRLGLRPKGRIEFLKGVRALDEDQEAELVHYAKNDAYLGRQVWNKLLPQLSNPEMEMWLIDHTFRLYLDRPLEIDHAKLVATRAIVLKRQEELVASAGVDKTILASDKKFATLIRVELQKAKIKLPMKKPAKPRKDGSLPLIPALSKNDAAFRGLAEHKNQRIASLVKARLVVRSSATVAARLATMEAYHKLGIGIPVHLVYYGAHTGRWSGGGGFNFQNLTSPDKQVTEIDRMVAKQVREVITPGKGNVFVAADAAQIECRVLAWLAGEDQILESFAAGEDEYSKFISGVLGEDIHKPSKDEVEVDPVRAVYLTRMRGLGKIAVLGLGYQMGVDKFLLQCKSQSRELAAMVDKGELNPEIAGTIVKAYRDKYTCIVDFWHDLERAFHRARMGGTVKLGRLTFRKAGDRAVSVELPNGRMLYYRDIRAERYNGKTQFTGMKGTPQRAKLKKVEWKHGAGQKIYGGLLTENIVQAVSRDILVEQGIYACEQAGYPVNLHIHDEVVCRVPKQKGQECLDFLVKSLSTPPEWGEGLVLGAEGRITADLSK